MIRRYRVLHYNFSDPRAAFTVRMINLSLEKCMSSIIRTSFRPYRCFHDSQRAVVVR